jgi:hypothetical protein
MDANLKKILDELPSKPPRSRLEPYREFIEELRSRGRTYRDIAGILAEKCAVQVTGSGVHDFIRTRSHASGRAKSGTKSKPAPTARPSGTNKLLPTPCSEEVQRRIAAIKARGAATRPDSRAFEFDPDKPLQLKRPDQQ